MLWYGNWLVPHYEGAPDMWNTKPPLLIWLQVVSMKFLGISEFAIRLPAAISGLLTAMILFRFSSGYLKNIGAGLLTSMVLCTTMAYLMNHGARTGDYDALLVLFMTASALCFFKYMQGERNYAFHFWILLSMAVLTKGVAGMMLIPGLFIFLVFQKKLVSTFQHKKIWLGSGVFILLVAGYYLSRETVNPGYLEAVYNNEIGGRYLETLEAHQHPFDYYYEQMKPRGFRYWFWFVLPAFVAGFLNSSQKIKTFTLFNFLMVFPLFIILSLGGTKLEWYVLPIYPFLVMQIGWFLYNILKFTISFISHNYFKKFAALLILALLFYIPVNNGLKWIHDFKEFPWDVEPHQPGYWLKNAMERKRNLNDHVVLYEGYSGQIDFYLNRLKKQGITTELKFQATGLNKGDKVLVNQQKIELQLKDKYSLQLLEEKYGCRLYLITGMHEK